MLLRCGIPLQVVVAVGQHDSPEFRRQSIDYFRSLTDAVVAEGAAQTPGCGSAFAGVTFCDVGGAFVR